MNLITRKNSRLNVIQERTIFGQPGNFLVWLSCSLLAFVKLLADVTLGPETTDALELVLEFCTKNKTSGNDFRDHFHTIFCITRY